MSTTTKTTPEDATAENAPPDDDAAKPLDMSDPSALEQRIEQLTDRIADIRAKRDAAADEVDAAHEALLNGETDDPSSVAEARQAKQSWEGLLTDLSNERSTLQGHLRQIKENEEREAELDELVKLGEDVEAARQRHDEALRSAVSTVRAAIETMASELEAMNEAANAFRTKARSFERAVASPEYGDAPRRRAKAFIKRLQNRGLPVDVLFTGRTAEPWPNYMRTLSRYEPPAEGPIADLIEKTAREAAGEATGRTFHRT